MNRAMLATLLLLQLSASGAVATVAAAEPDYGEWSRLLAEYYDPAQGMDYGGLEAREREALQRLQSSLARVDVGALGRAEQLAYWLNLYNIGIVTRVVAGYPTASIRDLSTDPFLRLNVFKKETVPFGSGHVSLNAIENERVRAGFHDPRIHFALNCAAKSCPPLRGEAYEGARLEQQLEEQVRRFLAGPGLRITARKGETTVRTVKILDWFADDFDHWGGGRLSFLIKYMPPAKRRLVPIGAASERVEFAFDDYDWALNDWKRSPAR